MKAGESGLEPGVGLARDRPQVFWCSDFSVGNGGRLVGAESAPPVARRLRPVPVILACVEHAEQASEKAASLGPRAAAGHRPRQSAETTSPAMSGGLESDRVDSRISAHHATLLQAQPRALHEAARGGKLLACQDYAHESKTDASSWMNPRRFLRVPFSTSSSTTIPTTTSTRMNGASGTSRSAEVSKKAEQGRPNRPPNS
jgi:hypothetical protein